MGEQQAKEKARRTRNFPAHTLEEALVIIRAIGEQNAGKPMDRLLLAGAIGRKPSSSEYRQLLSSSLKYGLTEGTGKAEYIKPTSLGLRIAKPTSAEEKAAALQQAALTPELLRRILEHYNRSKLPQGQFLKNVLERQFDVPPEYSQELAALIRANAAFVGFLQTIKGSEYIRIESAQLPPAAADVEDDPELQDGLLELPKGDSNGDPSDIPSLPTGPARPRQIFIGHGKKKGPLEELKKILDQFKIPYKVAVDEPHGGRPISQKIADLMNACSAAIFIFTKDEELHDKDGNTIWRPSENVIYELGAASVLYGTKIIIFKEQGVNFASDYQDLGYISFEGTDIASKALDLLRELIALEFVRLEAV